MKNEMDFRQEFEEQWSKYQEKHEIFPNIMILGRTGVGKSSLINAILASLLPKYPTLHLKRKNLPYMKEKIMM